MTQSPVEKQDSAAVPVYLVLSGDLSIEAPVAKVWSHLLEYTTWQNYSTVQSISGSPGQEGEVVLLKKEEAGVNRPPFYARTIFIEPERRVVWKTFRDGANYFGIVDFKVEDAGGQTLFSYSLIYEHLIDDQDEREIEAFRAQLRRDGEAVCASVYPKLKHLAEVGN